MFHNLLEKCSSFEQRKYFNLNHQLIKNWIFEKQIPETQSDLTPVSMPVPTNLIDDSLDPIANSSFDEFVNDILMDDTLSFEVQNNERIEFVIRF